VINDEIDSFEYIYFKRVIFFPVFVFKRMFFLFIHEFIHSFISLLLLCFVIITDRHTNNIFYSIYSL